MRWLLGHRRHDSGSAAWTRTGSTTSLIALYFVFVLGIGFIARRSVSSSLDFFLSGRSLPAWVTGLAFISANLGAVEIIGMSANGAQFGIPTVHYFWVGAVPAMLFLGVVMMPFYYGSKVRSVPEFMRSGSARRPPGQRDQLRGRAAADRGHQPVPAREHRPHHPGLEPLHLPDRRRGSIVLSYITLGGLSAAIYNEVLQFFIIVAALLPLTLVGLHKVGGYGGLKDKITAAGDGAAQLSLLAGHQPHRRSTARCCPSSASSSVSASCSPSATGPRTSSRSSARWRRARSRRRGARRSSASFPKMFIPFIVIFPGMIAGVVVTEVAHAKASGSTTFDYNNSMLYLIRDLLPNGMLGVAIAGSAGLVHGRHGGQHLGLQHGLLLRPVAGLHRQGPAGRLLPVVGRIATVAATLIAIGTALFASNYTNIMNYLQTLFGFFNAPLFATFILGMFWKRMTATAGWMGLVSGTAGRGPRRRPREGRARCGCRSACIGLTGQGASFVAAGAAFVVDIAVSVVVSLVTKPKPGVRAARAGLLADPQGGLPRRERGRLAVVPAADDGWPASSGVMVIVLNIIFW